MADRVLAKTWVVLSDVHVPYENKPFVDAACELIADIKPHGLILNGDIINFDEISRHNAGSVALLEGKRFAQSITATNKFLDKVDAAAGVRCKEKYWHDGNHESNLYRWMLRGDNAVFMDDPALSLPSRLRLKERGYIYKGDYPNAYTKIGKLLVTHGQYCSKFPAARHMEKYQVSTLVGHVHTEQTFAASTWDEPRISYTQGHMADEESEGMSYYPRPRPWISSFSVVHVRPNGMFYRVPVQWVDGAMFYGSNAYPKKLRRQKAA